MTGKSLWIDTTDPPTYPPLSSNRHTDVLVVGGGIAGLSTAFELTERGFDVILIEQDRIGSGTTGHTTAKLTIQHGLVYDTLIQRFGVAFAASYARANEEAIESIGSRIAELGIDAGFERTPSYVYVPEAAAVSKLSRECRALTRLDIPASIETDIPAPIEVERELRVPDQAQFHPTRYLRALAAEIVDRGNQIFEQTRATKLDPGTPCSVSTDRGRIDVDYVVAATLFPFSDRAGYFARMRAHRAYLLAVELDEPVPEGMYLSTDSPPATFRRYGGEDHEVMIVGGQSHPTERTHPPPEVRFDRCAAFARDHFDVSRIVHRWAAHDLAPVDNVPYIGSLGRLSPNTYVATGFNKWGMTNGTVAGSVIPSLIATGSHPDANVFDPLRIDPSTLPQILSDNIPTAERWMWDRLGLPRPDTDTLPDAGHGRVLHHHGRPIAVYRDGSGDLHVSSAICPHMYCIVGWNDAEKTWDCPCHGSRFEATGGLRDGPATGRLSNLTVDPSEEIRSP